MTGHHPWDELMRKHYTPEERERMLEDAKRELEEEEERRQVPAGPASRGPQGHGSADERPRRNAPEGR